LRKTKNRFFKTSDSRGDSYFWLYDPQRNELFVNLSAGTARIKYTSNEIPQKMIIAYNALMKKVEKNKTKNKKDLSEKF